MSVDPSEVDARLLWQAWAYLGAGRPTDARRTVSRYLVQNPHSIEALLVVADAECALGQFEDALAVARKAGAIDPDDYRVWCAMGVAQAELKAMPEAITSAERALALAPWAWYAHATACRVFRGCDLPEERDRAVDEGREAIRLAPDEPNAHIEYGNGLLSAFRYTEATAAYSEALRIDPGSLLALHNLAGIEAAKGQFFTAADGYANVLRGSPDDRLAQRNLAITISNATTSGAAIGVFALAGSYFIAVSSGDGLRDMGPVMAAMIALFGFGGLCVQGARLTSRRGLARILRNERPLMSMAWVMTTLSLAAALMLYLTSARTQIQAIVPPLAIMCTLAYYLAASRQLMGRVRREGGELDAASVQDETPEWVPPPAAQALGISDPRLWLALRSVIVILVVTVPYFSTMAVRLASPVLSDWFPLALAAFTTLGLVGDTVTRLVLSPMVSRKR